MDDINKICIIEDEVDIVETMTSYFENEGYEAISFNSAEEFYKNGPDNFKGLYLVDWNLPGEPGINIITNIRVKDKVSPIFMVSAFAKNEDIVEGLKRGADDYITKPFSFDTLIVKVKNSLSKLSIVSRDFNSSDEMRLLPSAKSFMKDGNTVNLTQREYIIFNHLYENLGQASTRQDLIDQFDSDDKMTERNIDVHVFSLRKKIKTVDLVVETVWGTGYKLSVVVR
jgi:DNA-binding response OmpR family regulator